MLPDEESAILPLFTDGPCNSCPVSIRLPPTATAPARSPTPRPRSHHAGRHLFQCCFESPIELPRLPPRRTPARPKVPRHLSHPRPGRQLHLVVNDD